MGKSTTCIGENKGTDQLRSNCFRIVQFLLYLTPKFQASSSFLCLYRSVCVGPGRNPNCRFTHAQAQMKNMFLTLNSNMNAAALSLRRRLEAQDILDSGSRAVGGLCFHIYTLLYAKSRFPYDEAQLVIKISNKTLEISGYQRAHTGHSDYTGNILDIQPGIGSWWFQ